MAVSLINSVALQETNIWKGGHLLLLGDPTTPPAFPTKIEDVIAPDTFAFKTGWSFFTATDENGFDIQPTYEVDKGIPTDQRKYNLLKGDVDTVAWSGSGTALYSDLTTLKKLWNLGGITAIAAVAGTTVAQRVANIGVPERLLEQQVAIVQQNNKTKKLRVLVFRKGTFTEPQAMKAAGRSVSSNAFTVTFDPDTTIVDGSDFGKIFEAD